MNNKYLNLAWLELCKLKWGIRTKELAISFELNRNFKLLFYHAAAVPNDLSCCDRLSLRGMKVSFSGSVGRENRSVMAVTPFPVVLPAVEESFVSAVYKFVFCPRKTHQKYLRKEYFSSPYIDANLMVNVDLRAVAYYEIDISKGFGRVRSNSNFQDFFNPPNNDGAEGHDLAPPLLPGAALLPECVAVGLSSSRFNASHRLPGWDKESYGYHGDDGGLFHGDGRQIAEYRTFGAGDVVGCGLDYERKSIFFTLNGAFLGIAFEDVYGELYPTVGIDAEVNVTFNFGRAPFKFDLNSYRHSERTV